MYDIYHCCVYSEKTPDDGQRNCPKHVEFHSKNKFVKLVHLNVKVKWSRYSPGVTQRVGRGIALLFHDRGTRRGWVVSSTPRPLFIRGKDPVPIVQEAGLAPGPVWTGGKCRAHRDSIPDRPARSSVAIPTELPGPQLVYLVGFIIRIYHEERSPERQKWKFTFVNFFFKTQGKRATRLQNLTILTVL